MKIYEKVRDYLDSTGIKQTFVARKTGIPITTLNAMLNGKRKMYADDLELICKALSVGADKFIEPVPGQQERITEAM